MALISGMRYLLRCSVVLSLAACTAEYSCDPAPLVAAWTQERSKQRDTADATQKRAALDIQHATRMLDMAAACPDEKRAVFALKEVLFWHPQSWGPETSSIVTRALTMLEQKYRTYVGPEMLEIIERYRPSMPKEAAPVWAAYERLIAALAQDHPDKTIRGYATLTLAQRAMKTVGGEDEEEALLKRVIAEYANIADPKSPASGSLGQQAQALLRELTTLSVSKLAPEIVGEDLHGNPMKLSDYRDQLILLTFWSSDCSKCMALVPQERAIAQRMRDKPFVLLGVSTDPERELALKTAERKGITWRNWWDGSQGPINAAWNIFAVPAVYLIDGRGVIRFKGIGYANIKDQIDTAIDEVLKQDL